MTLTPAARGEGFLIQSHTERNLYKAKKRDIKCLFFLHM